MAKEILIVEDIFPIANRGIAIVLYSKNKDLREKWRNTWPSELKPQLEGKKITLVGSDYQLETAPVGVEIASSITEEKIVAFLLEDTSLTRKIQRFDEVEIDL